jgi:integrase
MEKIEFADFESFNAFKSCLRANENYKGIEVSMTASKNKIRNVKTREDKNGLIKYRAVVSLNGKSIPSSWTYSLEEALNAREQLESKRVKQVFNNQHTIISDSPKIRFGTLIDNYLTDFAKGSGSYSNVRKFLHGKYIKPLYDKYLHELTNDDFNFFWLKIKRRDTANTYMSFLRSLLGYGKEQKHHNQLDFRTYAEKGYISEKISNLPVPADTEQVEKTQWLTSEGIEDLLITLKAHISEATYNSFKINREIKADMLELQLNLMARPSEVPAIDWGKSIQFDKNGRPIKVHIYKQVISKPDERVYLKGCYLKPPKNNKERTIKLNKRAIEIIEKYLQYKDSIPPYIDADGTVYNFVFPFFYKQDFIKHPYNITSIYGFWDEIRMKEPLKKYNLTSSDKEGGLYVLRHTGATHHVYLARKDRYEFRRISQRMGHENLEQLDTYIHLIDEVDPVETEKIFSYFKNEFSHIFAAKKDSIIANLASRYNGATVAGFVKILRANKVNLEPLDDISQIAMTDMSPENIQFMIDEFRTHLHAAVS